METREYERLASTYLDTIYRVALNGCRNYADAEDVVQNTFMKLFEKENRFEVVLCQEKVQVKRELSGLPPNLANHTPFFIVPSVLVYTERSVLFQIRGQF